MYRSLAAALMCGGILGSPIVDVPVGMQWAREFNDYSYEWHAANDQAGKIPAEPTQAMLLVSMLRLDAPATDSPWDSRRWQPDAQLQVTLGRADGTAQYTVVEPYGRPFAGTTTLVPDWSETVTSDGDTVPLSNVADVTLDPSQISTFLAPGVNFYLYVKPLTMGVQVYDVELSVSGSDPVQRTAFGTSATPLGGWQVVSADDPLSDPPAVPEPSTVLTASLALAVLTWKARCHQMRGGRSRSTAPVPISR